MLRISALLLVLVAACDVGRVPGLGDDQGPDAGLGGPDAADQLACRNAVATVGTGEHNAGQACLQAGCHAAGGEGPHFYVGGTLYTSAAGVAPNPGSVVTIKDGAGLIVDMTVMQNGNFYTTTPVIEPVQTFASKCPGKLSMASTAAGNCNTGGCHDGVAATGRVYLP